MDLYYLQSRYYDPELCRFLNADVVYDLDAGLQGFNLFIYCGNNPINRIDASGANSEDLDGDGQKEPYQDQGGGNGCPGGVGGGTGNAGVASNWHSANGNSAAPEGNSNSLNGGTGNNRFGTSMAPKQADPGSTYTQISSDGKATTVSTTTYNEHGLPGYHIDYQGRAHGGIQTPHIHIFKYYQKGENIYRCGEEILPYHRID